MRKQGCRRNTAVIKKRDLGLLNRLQEKNAQTCTQQCTVTAESKEMLIQSCTDVIHISTCTCQALPASSKQMKIKGREVGTQVECTFVIKLMMSLA